MSTSRINLIGIIILLSLINPINKLHGQIITTIAGNGINGYGGDNGLATNARINPGNIALDTSNNLYITGSYFLRKVNLTTGIITTIAGKGQSRFSGDGGLAKNATFVNSAPSIAIDSLGNILLADNGRIRKIDASTGIINTIIGNGTAINSGDGGIASNATTSAYLILFDKYGNLYLGSGSRIRKVDAKTNIITTLIGTDTAWFNYPNNLPRPANAIGNLSCMTMGADRTLFFFTLGDVWFQAIDVNTLSKKNYGCLSANAISTDYKYNVYLINSYSTLSGTCSNSIPPTIVRRDSILDVNTTIVGNGTTGFSGDGGLAINAAINNPDAPIFDKAGNLYFIDYGNARIRKVTPGPLDTLPKIVSFTPLQGCNTTTVTIKGKHFTNASNVSFGGVNAQSFTIDSDKSITAITNFIGTGKISITTPYGVAKSSNNYFAPSGAPISYAYTTNGNGKLNIINTVSGTLASTINVGTRPGGVCVSPDQKKVYLTTEDGYVKIINTSTNKITSSIWVGNTPLGICISPNGSKLYVTNNGSDKVTIISTKTNTIVTNVTVGNAPYSLCISPDGASIYVTSSYYGIVSVIDSALNLVTASISVGYLPRGICISSDGQKIYVANNSSKTISAINTTTYQVVASIPIGDEPEGICISPDGKKVYVTTGFGIIIINTATNTVKSNLVIGSSSGISISKDGLKVYIASRPEFVILDAIKDTVISTIAAYSYASLGNFIADITSNCGVLPLKLTKFAAKHLDNRNLLEWQTENEVNTESFVVEISEDGSNFREISSLKSRIGNNNYSYLDDSKTSSIVYYRLKMIDIDGSFTYSKIVSVSLTTNDLPLITISPNPAKDFANINFSKTVEKATIAVYDITGKSVITQSISGSSNNYRLNTQSLTNGVYLIKVYTATGSYNEKLLINK